WGLARINKEQAMSDQERKRLPDESQHRVNEAKHNANHVLRVTPERPDAIDAASRRNLPPWACLTLVSLGSFLCGAVLACLVILSGPHAELRPGARKVLEQWFGHRVHDHQDTDPTRDQE